MPRGQNKYDCRICETEYGGNNNKKRKIEPTHPESNLSFRLVSGLLDSLHYHITILLYYHITILYYHITILPYYYITILLYYHITILPWILEVLSRHAFVRCRGRPKADRPAGGRQRAAKRKPLVKCALIYRAGWTLTLLILLKSNFL